MSRVDSDGCQDFPGQLELYRANTERAIKGKRGQAFLRELEAALLALPEKRLAEGGFICAGEVCALAALALHRKCAEGKTRSEALMLIDEELGASDDPGFIAAKMKTSFNLAWEIMYLNDDEYRFGEMTPELRYEAMLKWVRKEIAP